MQFTSSGDKANSVKKKKKREKPGNAGVYLSDEHGHAGRVGFDADVAAGLDELSVDHGRRVERAPLGRFLKTRNGPSNNLRLVLCDDIAVTRVTVYSGRRLLK